MQRMMRVQRIENDQVAQLFDKHHGLKASADYAQRNYTAMRKLQIEVKERRLAESAPRTQPFKLSRFGSVASLVFKKPEEIQALRKSKLQPTAIPESSPTGPKDYVRENAHKAIFSTPKTVPVRRDDTPQSLNPSFGRVPVYLQRINQAVADSAKRQQDAAAARCPPGMRLLPKSEQIATLQSLEGEKSKAMSDLNRLPLGSNATSVIRLKEELERRLEDLEKLIGTFQRERVYVQA